MPCDYANVVRSLDKIELKHKKKKKKKTEIQRQRNTKNGYTGR